MKNYIIVDIDGTITKVGDRLKYLKQSKPDWDSFYNACGEDKPVSNIIQMLGFFNDDYNIIFCTGRRESVRSITTEWIYEWVGEEVDEKTLIMRPDGDYRHDTEVKPEQLAKAGIDLKRVFLVFEDRNKMVKKWRELGLTCLQVADGDF